MMAVFLVMGLIFAGSAVISAKSQTEKGILGGPSSDSLALAASANLLESQAVFLSKPISGAPDSASVSGAAEANIIQEAAALKENVGPDAPRNPAGLLPKTGNSSSFNSAAYFILPTQGFNWGKLHPRNAVDIANSCGTAIVASAGGLVSDISLDSWSEGYGYYVILSHPNGTKTRYAHLDKINVSLGEYVKQGEVIGTMGRTGDATGCHVHFEVEGATNPFAR